MNSFDDSKSLPENWHAHSFYAMGSHMAIWLETPDPATAAAAFATAESHFAQAEQIFSRFRPTSELSAVNASPERWVPVSEMFWEVLVRALEMAQATGGLFDPTMLPALESAGYTHSIDSEAPNLSLQTSSTLSAAHNPIPAAWTHIQTDAARQAVYLPAGVGLDLGGIVKGYTAQAVAARLAKVGPCLVDAGGDLAASGAPAGQAGWPVAIAAPWLAETAVSTDLFGLWLGAGGLATSGIDYRQWQHNGRTAHHIIDPRTHTSADTDIVTITVQAADAVTAEAVATAALVAGSAAGIAMLLEKQLSGLIVTRDQRILVTDNFYPHLQWLQELDYPLFIIGDSK